MPRNRNLERSLKKFSNKKQESLSVFSGTLGLPLNGQKLVEVPNRNGFVYVKLRDNQSEVIQAYNSEVSNIYGLAVLVARQGNIYKVIGRDQDRYRDWGNIPYLPKHGGQHSFNQALGMGADVTWIYSQQMMPLLGYPSGSVGSNGIAISPYLVRDLNGGWKYIGNTGTPDITMYRPTIATGAVMVLVYLDTVSGNPYLLVGSGSTFHAGLTGSHEIAPYIPRATNPNWIPDTAIRLVTGTTTLSWTNLYDVRPFLQVVPTGTSGGGGITGTSDSTYLRLDTTNDPLTGLLDIIPSSAGVQGLNVQVMDDVSAISAIQNASGTGVGSPVMSLTRGPSGDSASTFAEYLISMIQSRGASGTITGGAINLNSDGADIFFVNPSAQGTGTSFYINNEFQLSHNGLLLLLKNNGTSRFYVNASGTAYSNGVPLIKEAPTDGQQYARKNAGWEPVTSSGGGGSGTFILQENGQTLGSANTLNAGNRITATLSGTIALIETDTVLLQTDDLTSQINGTVTTFGPTTLLPVASSARLYYNGVRQRYNFHYTISGSYIQTLFTPTTGSVMLLDYNESSTTGTLTSVIGVQDEGVLKGNVSTLNFVGGGVDVSVNGTVAQVNITGAVLPAMVKIGSLSVSGSYASYFNIPQTYRHLIVKGVGRSTKAASQDEPFYIYFNANRTSANYRQTRFFAHTAGTTSADGADTPIANDAPAASATSGMAVQIDANINNYTDTSFNKYVFVNLIERRADVNTLILFGGHEWESTNAINAIELFLNGGGNWVAGTAFDLYGVY